MNEKIFFHFCIKKRNRIKCNGRKKFLSNFLFEKIFLKPHLFIIKKKEKRNQSSFKKFFFIPFLQFRFLLISFYDCRCYLGFARKARTCSRNTGSTRRRTWQRRDFTKGNSRNSISRRWWVHQWVHYIFFFNNEL